MTNKKLPQLLYLTEVQASLATSRAGLPPYINQDRWEGNYC